MSCTQAHLGVHKPRKSLRDRKTVSNSPQNGPESAKMASVNVMHVSAPRGSVTMEIAPCPKTVSNSPLNGSQSAKTVSVDERYVSAPRGPPTIKITSGPQNGEL